MKSAVLAGSIIFSCFAMAIQAPAAQAAGSAFQGSIFAPDRGETTVVIRGDLAFDPEDCPLTVDGYKRGRIEMHDITVGIVPTVPGTGTIEVGVQDVYGGYRAPAVGSSYIETTYYSVEPGLYVFSVVARYWKITGNDETPPKWIACKVLDQQPINVVEKVSQSRTTKASASRVLLGESVRLTLETSTLWSDGESTSEPAPSYGNYRLQQRAVGSSEWATIESSGATASVAPRVTTEYRYLEGSALSTPVTVEVTVPTTAVRFESPVAMPSGVIEGALVTITASIETQYTDGVWRPSPTGTTFEVQFLADGASQWSIVSRNSTTRPGAITSQFTAVASGTYRFAAGASTSAGVAVAVIRPVGVVALSEPQMALTVKRGSLLRISSSAQSAYTDGVTRPTPVGTPFTVEFAPAAKRGAAMDTLKWRTAQADVVRSPGLMKITSRATASGYWRIRVDQAVVSDARFVQIRRQS